MKSAAYLVLLCTLMLSLCRAQTKTAEANAPPKLEKMTEALEIRFASSAAPPHLRDNATIYVLDPAKGYVVARQGTNGVSCIVVRSDWQWASPLFRDDIYWPVCFAPKARERCCKTTSTQPNCVRRGWIPSRSMRQSQKGSALRRLRIHRARVLAI